MGHHTHLNEEDDCCHSSFTQQYQLPKIIADNNTYFNKKTLIICKRCCGKTSFIIYEIYRQLQYVVDHIYVISRQGEEYNGITKTVYMPDDLNKILAHIRKDKTHSSLIILDDN